MTNERAIEIIKRKTSIPLEGESWEEIDEAYDMAIKALETIELVKFNIYALNELIKEV